MPADQEAFPYGGEVVRNEAVAVSTTSILISPAHKRQEIIIINSSSGTQRITISIGKEAILDAGVTLQPWGAWYGSANSEFRVASENIYVISSAASGQISIFER